MLVFRIALWKYTHQLMASGRAARWNSNEVKVMYASGSQSLCCLENIVHRSKLGLTADFGLMHIHIPDDTKILSVNLEDLPENWNAFDHIHITQKLGNQWVSEKQSAVLRVPSSIIHEEPNYLINPAHPEFNRIKLLRTNSFLFDDRIKD